MARHFDHSPLVTRVGNRKGAHALAGIAVASGVSLALWVGVLALATA